MAGSHRWEDRKDRDENKKVSELFGVSADDKTIIKNNIFAYASAIREGRKPDFFVKILFKYGLTMEEINRRAKQIPSQPESHDETLIDIALKTYDPQQLQFTERLAKPYESKSYWRLTRTVSKRTGLRAHVLAIKWLDNNLFVAFATGGKIGSGGGFPVYRYSGVTSAQHKYLLKQEANPGKWVHRMLGEADEYIGQVSISEVKADDVISQTQELQSRADEAKRNRG